MKIHGIDVMRDDIDLLELRRLVGMVFQKYNPFAMSIFENVAYSSRIAGIKDKKVLAEIVEKSLRDAALWDDVKDRLKHSAFGLSGGQQQRLCIARAIANQPEILLMDEPTSAMDYSTETTVAANIAKFCAGRTLLIATHRSTLLTMCDRIIVMDAGRIVADGPRESVMSALASGKITKATP